LKKFIIFGRLGEAHPTNRGGKVLFLATTALEEFWDKSQKIVFLGEWCKLYDRKGEWGKLEHETLPYHWDDRQKFYEAYRHVNEIYECLLPHLAKTLNIIHAVCYSEHYWRIVIGAWLQLYISVVYDRYITLQTVSEKYLNFTTIGLSEESFVIPRDTLEFVQFMKGDFYNLQLYTKILLLLGKEFPRKNRELIVELPVISNYFRTLKARVTRLSIKMLASIEKKGLNDRRIILKDSYFSWITELQLFLRTHGTVIPSRPEPVDLPSFQINRQIRLKLQFVLPEGTEFEKLLKMLLPFDMPQSFIEGYNTIGKEMSRNYPVRPKAIFSATAWYFDEIFKQWAAASAESGTILLGSQHGGNYGSISCMPSEDYETAIVNRYYSWGWVRFDCRSRVIPLAASKFIGRTKIDSTNAEGILFGVNSWHRYLIRLLFPPHDFVNYMIWQSRFLKSISPRLLSRIRVRLHREDYGWDIAQRWKDFHPHITLENNNITFLKSLKKCRLYVCDQLATTFLESLSSDKPTILFWDHKANELRPEAEPYYDKLRNVGILYDTPEAAAIAVNSIYEDVENWWNDPERRAAKRIFCDHFARTSANAVSEWVTEFKKIAEESE